MKHRSLVVTIIILCVLLPYSSPALTDSAGNSEWQILTKRNFSSEIRLHPNILLMVTIPWSGEARSLMKQLGMLVADQPEKYSHLRLMIIYKNSEKMLANVLGATDDIAFYYYHKSTSYKYNGRFAAEKILSSVNYFMSLKSEEVPLKTLHTKDELDFFLESTDKTVILIELCGWSSKLLHKKTLKNSTSVQSYSMKDGMFKASSFAEVDERLSFELKRTQKGLFYGVENELTDSQWPGEFCAANSSTPEDIEHEAADVNLSCTEEEFEQFKTFFSKFKFLAREYFLLPERVRFGLIHERALLSSVGVNTMGSWLAILQFNGCPSCLLIIETIDDLRKILQEQHSPITQLDVDGHNLVPAFPANRPSVVLFIDRLSDSSEIGAKSKSALNVFRKVAEHYQPSYRMNRGERHGYKFLKDSSPPKQVEVKDTMTIIINEDQSISSEQSASDARGNAMYNALLEFINKRNFASKKQTKVSFIAKEIGFQLLSDDFEVQIADSSPYYVKQDQLSKGDQTSKLHQQHSDDYVNQNDDLRDVTKVPVVDYAKQAALENAEDNQGHVETAIEENCNTDEDKSCEKNGTVSLLCHTDNSRIVNNSLIEREGPSVGICMEKYAVDAVGCSSNAEGAAEVVSRVGPSDDFAAFDRFQVEKDMIKRPSKEHKEHKEHQPSQCSFFFIDGGYRLLNSLTGGSRIPSLVLLNPVEQQHYVFDEDKDMDFSSLTKFVEKFLKGSLSPYQPSASSIVSTKEAPQPPFVNLDFHEVDAIPRLTTNTFCELVFGFKPCVTVNAFPITEAQRLGAAWKKDVVVLFGSSWCGFCQRMEILVREVFHTFKYLKDMLRCGSSVTNSGCFQDNNGDMMEYSLPSVFLMDCSQNDCGSFLKSVSRNEYYPELLLYPAQNKTAIPYEGAMQVVNIIKFIVSQGRNSQFLNKYKGYLWKRSSNNRQRKSPPPDSFPLPISTATPPNIAFHEKEEHRIVPGSVLSATDKLQEAIPFDNSTILITLADEGQQAVQGIILNKPLSWNVFDHVDKDLEHLRHAPLFYGGPVMAQGLPLVSLARKPTEGYTKVVPGFYYGSPVMTRMVVEGIETGGRSVQDYLFFLGYCSWNWDQIFDELAKGAWHLSAGTDRRLHWLDN